VRSYKPGAVTEVKFVGTDGITHWAGIHPTLDDALDRAERVYREEAQRDLVVTELFGGRHVANSFHYIGRAADLRTNTLRPEVKTAVYTALVAALAPLKYTVVDEGDHFHIEPAAPRSDYPPTLV